MEDLEVALLKIVGEVLRFSPERNGLRVCFRFAVGRVPVFGPSRPVLLLRVFLLPLTPPPEGLCP